MAYKSVKFLAQEWREIEDPATAELIIEASFPTTRKRCLVLAEPVPGSDPIVVKYSCLAVSCTGENQCVLKKREEADGSIVYYCDCEPIGARNRFSRRRQEAAQEGELSGVRFMGKIEPLQQGICPWTASACFSRRTPAAFGVLARSLTRTPEDADDLVQQAFTIAITKRAEIPDDAWPWLAKVVSNCARNHHRYRARRQGMEDVHEAAISGREPDPAEAAGKRELVEALHGALGELSHDEREAVALCHLGGLSQSQACQIVGVELNTLKARVRRGLQHLQQKLGLSEVGVSAFLTGFVFPPPAEGWDSAITRWERQARDAADVPVPPQPFAVLKLFGFAALASLAGAGVWLALNVQNAGADQSSRAAGNLAHTPAMGNDATPVVATESVPGAPGVEKGSIGESSNVENTPGTGPAAKPDTAPEKTTPPDPSGEEQRGSLQVRTTYYANGRIELQWTELVTPGKSVKHGTLTHYWPNGNVMETGEYKDDLREGPWTFRYEDNVKSTEGGFLHGKPHGLWKTFDEKGNPETQGHYENAQHVGEWLTLHPMARRRFAELRQDKLNGLETEFDDHGRKRRETQWVDNKKHGWEILWDENGNETSRKLFKQGK